MAPDGAEYRRAFQGGEAARVHPADLGAALADGVYAYAITFVTDRPAPEGEGHVASVQSGAFEVRSGEAVASPVMDDVVIDDQIIQGSLCVGVDCVNGEAFGFDTIRLKENNLRIRFTDTSNSGSFPTNDWEITINDSSNGGANYFAVTDVNASRVPFRIEAGARAEAVHIDATGRVGFGTATPVLLLHTLDGDTPTLRLDQSGAQGYSPQTWDVAGNEANFFVRDAGANTLPLRIRPGAPTSAIDVQADGAVFFNADYTATGATIVLQVRDEGTGADLLTLDSAGNLVVSGTVTDGAAPRIAALEVENAELRQQNADLAERLTRIEALLRAEPVNR